MKVTLVALTVVGMTLLVGGGRCVSDYVTAKEMDMLMGDFRIGTEMANPVMSYAEGLRHCTCMVRNTGGNTDEQKCQCIRDMKECDDNNKVDSSMTFEETRETLFRWANCLGPKKIRVAYRCREEMIQNPYQMMCKDWTMNCE
ncbi:uncharacterized protein LOC135108556 [Scylla paramamosain]|uniref:uncharacterized protein LOC135108556 n=1 Tax=Scylla paramamosain TaxID=85552 RepID=UPI00308325C1